MPKTVINTGNSGASVPDSDVTQQPDLTISADQTSDKKRSHMEALLRQCIADEALSNPVKMILFGPWLNVMFLTYMEEGADSRRMNHNLRFVRALIWSVRPKTTVQQREKLTDTIPKLLTLFKRGLQQINYPVGKRKALLKMLEVCHLLSMRGKSLGGSFTQEALTEIVEKENYTLLLQIAGLETNDVSELVQEFEKDEDSESIVLSETSFFVSSESMYDYDEHIEQSSGIKEGDWVEIDHLEARVCCKVLTINDVQSTITFVDRYNIFVTRKTVNGFAAELRRKSAKILKNPPLIDRILQSVIHKIDKPAKK